MSAVIAIQGWPGSGKTTWAKEWVKADLKRSRLSRDDLRASVFASEGILETANESMVTKLVNAQLKALIQAGRDVVIDATNLNQKSLSALAKITIHQGASFDTFAIDTDVNECVRRDFQRALKHERSVGEDVIRKFAKRYPMSKWPEMHIEGPEETRKYTGTPGKPRAFLLDLDGTIAHMNGRSPYDTSKYHEDIVDDHIADIVHAMKASGYKIIVSSGRDAAFKAVSQKWLYDNASIVPHKIVMRKEGDLRMDAVVKEELFWSEIAPFYDVQFVLDDRNQVVERWRAMGIKCLQVAEGDF